MPRNDKDLLIELSGLVVGASVNWTGWDEEKIPMLKKLRTIAGYHLTGAPIPKETCPKCCDSDGHSVWYSDDGETAKCGCCGHMWARKN